MNRPFQSDKNKWENFWAEASTPLLKGEIGNEDSWYALSWKMGLSYWSEAFYAHASGRRLLECGAGAAKTSVHMAKQGYECFLLDTSLKSLEIAKDNFVEACLPGRFILSKAEEISLKNDSIDIVYSGGLLNYFDDIEPFVKEMCRVLKPGGVFAATMITSRKVSCQTLGDFQIFLAKFIKHLLKGEIKGIVKKSSRNFPFYENALSLKDYKKVLEDCNVNVLCATGTNPFPAIALPKVLRPFYAMLMKTCLPFWRWFDRSQSRFTEKWGIAFSVYGIKQTTKEKA